MTSSLTSWRLIETGPLPGPLNMAMDEALLNCFDPQSSAPILRLYGWYPPAFSLGRFQDARSVLDIDLCKASQIPVVRRITGGGAIFHAEELTYSIICSPHQIPPFRNIKESFRLLTGFLLSFYRSLGLSAEYAEESGLDDAILGARDSFCFAGYERYDILIQGKKIGGNAQRRLKNVIFQHGSIPTKNTVDNALAFLIHQNRNIADKVSCLESVGVRVSIDELKNRIIKAFEESFDTSVFHGALNEKERNRYFELERGKYASDVWNLGGEEV